MDLFLDIIFKSLVLSTLIFAIFGCVLSLLLIFSPEQIRRLSRRFDRYVDVDEKLNVLDIDIPTDQYIYRHHLMAGGLFLLGSLFILAFMFFEMDNARFVEIFFNNSNLLPLNEIILKSSVLILKAAGIAGIALGLLLLFASNKMKSLGARMALTCKTKPFVDRLNTAHYDIDFLFLRYPVLFGVSGFVSSAMISYLCIRYILG